MRQDEVNEILTKDKDVKAKFLLSNEEFLTPKIVFIIVFEGNSCVPLI